MRKFSSYGPAGKDPRRRAPGENPSHEETVAFQAERHELIFPDVFFSREEYVLSLVHKFAYQQAARLAENLKVLDLGCNAGYGSAIMSESRAEVVGADVSPKAISKAEDTHGSRGIRFELVNGRELPFKDGEFDLIASFQVIEHIVDRRGYLGEIKRVLAPGGLVMLATPNSLLRLSPGMRPWNPFHVREFNARELDFLLKDFFPATRVVGLFAEEPLYSVEINRLKKIRAKSARRTKIKKLIPRPLLNAVRQIVKASLELLKTPGNPPGYDPDPEDAGGPESLFYDYDTDSALDLAAFCADNASILSDALRKLDIRREFKTYAQGNRKKISGR